MVKNWSSLFKGMSQLKELRLPKQPKCSFTTACVIIHNTQGVHTHPCHGVPGTPRSKSAYMQSLYSALFQKKVTVVRRKVILMVSVQGHERYKWKRLTEEGAFGDSLFGDRVLLCSPGQPSNPDLLSQPPSDGITGMYRHAEKENSYSVTIILLIWWPCLHSPLETTNNFLAYWPPRQLTEQNGLT